MKELKKLAFLFVIVSLSFSCDGERDLDCEYFNDCDGGGGGTAGNVTFWNDQSWVGQITVNFDGSSATITSNVNPSGCNTSGCANFTKSPGTYNYTASATTGENWGGTATVSSGGCLLLNLQ